jgi:hypothetical protein
VKRRWRILPGAEPAVHRWGDEFVVHHAMSNDTYRLSVTAGRILSEIMMAAIGPAGGGASAGLTDDAEAETCLSTLVDLGFLTQC